MKKTGIVWGICLILLGGLFACKVVLGQSLNIFFRGWWTLFIIIPCTIGLFTNKDKAGSIIGIVIGVLLLLAARDYVRYINLWKLFLPALLIIIGVKVIIKAIVVPKDTILISDGKDADGNFGDNGNDTDGNSGNNGNDTDGDSGANGNGEQYCAAFSGQDINYQNKEFNNMKLAAIFGGIKCNLKNAIFKDEKRIDVCCIFGGADILVPANVAVKSSCFCLFGGVDDKRTATTIDENAAVLYINGFCMFGGVDIK